MSFPRGCERNHTAVVRRAHALQDGLERPRRFASVTGRIGQRSHPGVSVGCCMADGFLTTANGLMVESGRIS